MRFDSYNRHLDILYNTHSVAYISKWSIHHVCSICLCNQDISEFDSEAQKKIEGFRNKLVTSHTRNK